MTAANNFGVLDVSLVLPQQKHSQVPSLSDFLDHCIGRIRNLVHIIATTSGAVMALATVDSRHMWQGLTAASKS